MTGHAVHLLLARHGETVWHAENRYAGAHSDVNLTDRGREQAAALAKWAAGRDLAALVVSPVRRAQETARPVALSTGLSARVVPDLREVHFGVAEGRTVSELAAEDDEMVRAFRRDPDAHPFPGAERPSDGAERSARALRSLAADHAGNDVLVVAHNTILRLALCELLGLPVGHYRRLFPRLENVAVTEVRLDLENGTASLLRLNVPPRADPVPPAPSSVTSTVAAHLTTQEKS